MRFKKNTKVLSTFLLIALISISLPTILIPTTRAALPLDPTTIPKYVTPLVAQIPVYSPTNVLDGLGNVIRQDYYVNVTQFEEQILPTGFPVTSVWGYGGQAHDPITGAEIGYFRNSPSATFNVTRNIPTKITWVNNLTDPVSGNLLNYLYPVDPTLHWANPNNIPMDQAMAQAMAGQAPPYPPGYNGTAIVVNATTTNPNGWNAQSPAPIVTHVHGAEVQSDFDGGPEQWFTPDGRHGADYSTYEPTNPNAAVYYYTNGQEEATIWYHDHALGLTRINVYSGLAGYYIITDPANPIHSSLPTILGTHDVPLAIQDRSFFDNGSLRFDVDVPPNPDMHPYWVPEFFGDTFMVNGKTWPYFNVDQSLYRFRLLDGCNARFLNITLVDLDNNNATVPFTIIARDQSYLNSSVTENSVLFGPGMRAEILVNFTSIPTGHRILMMNDANAPFPNGNPVLPGLTDQIMMFNVGGAGPAQPAALPSTLNPTLTGGSWPTLPSATRQRVLTLTEVMGMGGPLEVLLDGQKWINPTSELPVVGTTETWMIANPTADAHPMHWHLVQFQLVSRQPFDDVAYLSTWETLNGGPAPLDHPTITPGNLTAYYNGTPTGPEADEQGWLDTVTMYPGQVTTIRIRYAQQDGSSYPFDPTVGPGYVWHCHIVDHEDNEMMRRQVVINPADLPTLENVIRTPTNAIQYRTYDFGTNTWSSLTTIDGQTADSPAATVANGRLYMVVKGMDNSSLYFGNVNLSNQAFSGWTYITGSSPLAPTLTNNGTHLALVVKGVDNSIYYRLYNIAGSTWGSWIGLSAGSTSDRIAATFIGSNLDIVVKAVDNPITMWFNSINVQTGTTSGWTWIPGSTPSTPEIVKRTATNAFELVVRGEDNMIYINQWNGAAFQGWTALAAGSTSASPAITIVGDNLFFIVIGEDGTTMYYSAINLLTNGFSGWTALSGSVVSTPELAS